MPSWPTATRPRALLRTAALLPVLLLAVMATGTCDRGQDESARTPAAAIRVTDDAGRIVALDVPAQRIISLVPAQTDILLELGAGSRLIARTDFDTQPELRSLPSTGNALTPNIEWIAAQQPDLVISWADAQSRSVVSRLGDLGIATYASAVESIADVERSIERLGVLTGRAAAADSVVDAMRAGRTAVERAVAGRRRPGVFYVIGLEPTMAAGPGTFVDEAIDIAGGRNVFSDAHGRWPLVSMEEVVRRDPDVIVLGVGRTAEEADSLIARLREMPGWRELAAVRHGRVHWADPHLFNRPAPSIIQATRRLAAMFFPDAP